jgi:CelD/BcsL family acetyltransferase involved in cellulose biosynthesis
MCGGRYSPAVVTIQIRTPQAMTPGFQIVSGFDELQKLRSEWDQLSAGDPRQNPFQSFTWTQAWLRSFAHTYERFMIIRCEEPGRFRGFIPLIVKRTRCAGVPVRALELAGGNDTVYKGPVGQGDYSALVERALRGLKTEVRGWDTLVLDSLPSDAPWMPGVTLAGERKLLPFDRHPPKPAPFLTLPDNYEELRRNAKKSLRQNLSRKSNMAEREGIVIERVSGANVREEHLREAQEVERRSWKYQKGIGIFIDDAHFSLHAGLLDPSAPYRVDLVFLRLAGQAIAFQYGFLQAERYFAYNTSYDEEYQRLSPGMLAINALLQQLIPEGIRTFDFLVGEDAYKWDWTAEARTIQGFTMYRGSLAGQLAFRMQRLRPPLRRIRNAMRNLRQPTAAK